MLKWTGRVRITVRDLAGRILSQEERHNLITTVGLNMVRDTLAGDVADAEIKWMGVGNDNTPPALADVTLGGELIRKALTSSTKPANGQYRSVFYVAPDDAVGLIEELGWFAGVAATAAANSGIMVARILYNRVKTNLESIQVERLDALEEV